MKDKKLIYGVGGLVLGAFIFWIASTSAINNQNLKIMGMMGFRSGSAQLGKMNNSIMDAHFIEQMIPHHEDAITMAKLALEKAEHKEIKTLAQNIIDSQSGEINQMKSWYNDWFGKDVPVDTRVMGGHGMGKSTKMHMGMMGDESDIERLKTTVNFDEVFIEEMIPHHQMAVMMANMLKSGTQKPEMKQLAEDIISAQTKEINEMRQWYSSWGY